MKNSKLTDAGLMLALVAGVALWNQGCKGTIPSVATMAANTISPCVPVLLNGFESLTENGTLIGSNATRALFPLYATQGANSIDVDITVGSNYNADILVINGFTPNVWAGKAQLLMDVTADASIIAGASYHQMVLIGDAGGSGIYFKKLSSSIPSLEAGSQTIAWTLDYPEAVPAGINANSTLTGIRITYNNNAAPGGLGHMYIDNLRLVCP